jgi:uncharacterized membrane protein (Fun14 family)
MRMGSLKIVGIVLLVVGLVVLILGAYDLITFNNSTGGKIANSITGVLGTRPETVKNAIIQICIGAACSVVGFILYRKS